MEKKQQQQKLATYIILGILSIGLITATVEYTQTMVQFNIASVLAYTVTLLGESGVESNSTSALAPTSVIYFNSSTGNEKAVNAQVVAGSTQSDGNPIFTYDNIGTVDIAKLQVYLNGTTPSCIKLLGKTTWSATAAGADILIATNVSVTTTYGPGDAAQAYYLWANFTDCGTANYYRNVISAGEVAD